MPRIDHKKIDRDFGLHSESLMLDVLKVYFDKKIYHTQGRYHNFDFTDNDKLFVELKSRRCHSNQYPTTLIPLQKINSQRSNNDYYYVFCFIDKIMIWQYDESEFDIKPGGRMDRQGNEWTMYGHVATSHLKEIMKTTPDPIIENCPMNVD